MTLILSVSSGAEFEIKHTIPPSSVIRAMPHPPLASLSLLTTNSDPLRSEFVVWRQSFFDFFNGKGGSYKFTISCFSKNKAISRAADVGLSEP